VHFLGEPSCTLPECIRASDGGTTVMAIRSANASRIAFLHAV
jgi:hypothetical protein